MEQTKTIWSRNFVFVFCANIFMYLGIQMCTALIPKYLDSIGCTALIVGTTAGIFAATALVFKLISAPIIDTFNRRRIQMAALSVMTVSFIGYGLSMSLMSIIIFRLIQGATQAFTATCALAMAASFLPEDRLAQGIGIFSVAQAACQAVTPTIALVFAGLCGYKGTFYISGGCAFIAILFISRIELEKKHQGPLAISLRNIVARNAVLPAVIALFLGATYWAINSFMIVYGGKIGIPDSRIGLFFVIYAGIMLLARPFYGKLADRFGYLKVIAPAMVIYAISFFIIASATGLSRLLIAACLSSLGYGSCQPVLQALCMRSAPVENQGAASCTFYIGYDLGTLSGPVLAGFLVDVMGYQMMWICMIIPIAVALTVTLMFRARFDV